MFSFVDFLTTTDHYEIQRIKSEVILHVIIHVSASTKHTLLCSVCSTNETEVEVFEGLRKRKCGMNLKKRESKIKDERSVRGVKLQKG